MALRVQLPERAHLPCAGPTPHGLQADKAEEAPLESYLERWWDEEKPSWEMKSAVSAAEFLKKLVAHLQANG